MTAKVEIQGRLPEIEENSFVDDSDASSSEWDSADEASEVGGGAERHNVKNLSGSFKGRIRNVRVLVLIAIVVAGTFVSALTFQILDNAQKNDFRDAFLSYVETIETRTISNGIGKATGLAFLSQSITAESLFSSSPFPHVTLPMFDSRGAQTLVLSTSESITYSPILVEEEIEEWLAYSISNQAWISEMYSRHNHSLPDDFQVNPFLFEVDDETSVQVSQTRPYYAPSWQVWPIPSLPVYNFDIMSVPTVAESLKAVLASRSTIFSEFHYFGDELDIFISADEHEQRHESIWGEKEQDAKKMPHFFMLHPVFDRMFDPVAGDPSAQVKGLVTAITSFDAIFREMLPEGTKPVIVVLKNDFNQAVTFRIEGRKTFYVDDSEVYDPHYEDMKVDVSLEMFYQSVPSGTNVTRYSLTIIPTEELEHTFHNSLPLFFTLIVTGTFVLMTSTFLLYDRFVAKRNAVVTSAAARSDAIVTSMFPSNVRDRLYEEAAVNANDPSAPRPKEEEMAPLPSNSSHNQVDENGRFKTKPIADLFPETTIMFADLAGFTAWSSVREPTQVFILLETVYRAFDEIASRRKVYKVETVGDCYVAVCGLPKPKKDHAIVMARFARECLQQMNRLTRELEIELGPDTSDLKLRVGLHSGAVTAGVLRGERSRFQLFGDTMNTAARMEQTGKPGRIQLSADTAKLLRDAEKESWLEERKDVVPVKGKGNMHTFWLKLLRGSDDSLTKSSSMRSMSSETALTNDMKAVELSVGKLKRLISWNSDVLSRHLKQIEAQRKLNFETLADPPEENENEQATGGVLLEVSDVIEFSTMDNKSKVGQFEGAQLEEEVTKQLNGFVANIAALYHDNPFHNFEHASHVTMSVTKMLSRVAAPRNLNEGDASLHDYRFGIISDPLTQFACVFSALIHDVDHPGVPNRQLVAEKAPIAEFYLNKSVAEQNSVDLTWSLLMSEEYSALRNAIYRTEEERQRFRQLVVNSVMATDIMDKDLNQQRNKRWEGAFCTESHEEESQNVTANRKATVVIEHLIQASDVVHTMQHWHVYRKWNERLFMEMLSAYGSGRTENHPVEGWYEGEIDFFDNCIIPLAQKLKDCDVFGAAGEEYLVYALQNREELAARGREVVVEMLAAYEMDEPQ